MGILPDLSVSIFDRILVDADDVVAVLGQTGSEHKAAIACSDDSYAHFTIRY
jgi:hypothetical protein